MKLKKTSGDINPLYVQGTLEKRRFRRPLVSAIWLLIIYFSPWPVICICCNGMLKALARGADLQVPMQRHNPFVVCLQGGHTRRFQSLNLAPFTAFLHHLDSGRATSRTVSLVKDYIYSTIVTFQASLHTSAVRSALASQSSRITVTSAVLSPWGFNCTSILCRSVLNDDSNKMLCDVFSKHLTHFS
jgi:hypothetical protein